MANGDTVLGDNGNTVPRYWMLIGTSVEHRNATAMAIVLHGDFNVVLKWEHSALKVIRASEFLKLTVNDDYTPLMKYAESPDDHLRKVVIA